MIVFHLNGSYPFRNQGFAEMTVIVVELRCVLTGNIITVYPGMLGSCVCCGGRLLWHL